MFGRHYTGKKLTNSKQKKIAAGGMRKKQQPAASAGKVARANHNYKKTCLQAYSHIYHQIECLPTLQTWHRMHAFPRLAQGTYFPALGTRYIFSRAWHKVHIFPRLAPGTCFPALGTDCKPLLRVINGLLSWPAVFTLV